MKVSKSYRVFQVFNMIFMCFVVLVTLYPFLNIVARAFSDEKYIISGAISLWPKGWNMNAFRLVFQHPSFFRGYFNTIFYTFMAVVVSLFMHTICAYPMSKTRLPGRKFFMGMIMFTMFFGGGLVPNFLLVKRLGMYNTVWAITIPGAIAVWNVIIMMTFFQGIPEALEEAGQVDGLGMWGNLWYIVAPLSKPIFATMILFFAVGQWNNWFGPLIYLQDNKKQPITLFLRNILMSAQQLSTSSSELATLLQDADSMPAESLKAASIVLVTVPILVLYPFAQKYFVKGVMIGSVKG